MDPSEKQVSEALMRLLAAWYEFKQGHNLEDPKIACCEKTQNLFIALELFKESVGQWLPSVRK